MGSVLLDLDRYAEAIDAAQQALRLQPKCAEAHCVLGLARHGLGEIEAAIREFEIALEIDANNFEPRVNLANIYFDSARYPEALEEIEKALKLQPENPVVRSLLGAIHAKLGHVNIAREQLAALKTLNPDYAEKLQKILEE
jgi:tetratricopeptide (TPR) repeat protein